MERQQGPAHCQREKKDREALEGVREEVDRGEREEGVDDGGVLGGDRKGSGTAAVCGKVGAWVGLISNESRFSVRVGDFDKNLIDFR